MDTCAIKVDESGKYLSENFSKGAEKTSDTSKNYYGEYGNVHNSILNFYKCGKKICRLTYESACLESDQTLDAIQG